MAYCQFGKTNLYLRSPTQRIQRAKKKIAQRNLLIAQAEVRETRTRRRAARPDYAYMNDPEIDVSLSPNWQWI